MVRSTVGVTTFGELTLDQGTVVVDSLDMESGHEFVFIFDGT